jgi:hypothetical protein
MPKALLPAVHLNGTSRETLFREYNEAYEATRHAIEKLRLATCHGRDYYVLGDTAYTRARSERDIALAHLETVEDYLSQFVHHLSPEYGR